MSAKTELFVRLQYLYAASTLPILVDVGIAPSEHNGVANLLRKGLGIVAFNILEDFIKNKSTETLDILSASTISFTDLTTSLQESTIVDALKTIQYRATLEKRANLDYKLLIQNESLNIHSTKNTGFTLSKYSFFYGNPNINASEIPDFLKALGIVGGWTKLTAVSNAIGGGLPDLFMAYNNAATRRHRSAHTAAFLYEHLWTVGIKNDILAIAASMDIIVTARCRQVTKSPALKIDAHNIDTELNYRFLEFKNGIYRETKSIGGTSLKNWPDLTTATAHLQPLLAGRQEFLIILNATKRIEDWYV